MSLCLLQGDFLLLQPHKDKQKCPKDKGHI